MKIINYRVFAIGAAMLFVSCQSQKDDEKNIKSPVKHGLELSARLDGTRYVDSILIIHIATTINNPTDHTLGFVTMSCSYDDMYLTNSADLKVSFIPCDKNYPTVMKIPPQSKLDQFIELKQLNRKVRIADSTLKIGMYLQIPDSNTTFDGIVKLHENREQAPVLWSNDLDLKQLFNEIYK